MCCDSIIILGISKHGWIALQVGHEACMHVLGKREQFLYLCVWR